MIFASPVTGKIYQDVIYIKPSYSFLTIEPLDGFTRSARQMHNETNLKKNQHNGEKSEKARKRIRLTLGYIMLGTRAKESRRPDGTIKKKYYLTHATFTLPSKQRHSDNEIKAKLLNQLLIELGQGWNVNNYIWLAEPQKHGNIHFHLTCDRYIPKAKLRVMWNRILNKLGYIDEFMKKHGHSDPPSVRIEAVRNVKNIEAYFSGEYTGDKSKDYNEYIDKNTKEVKRNYSHCNLHAIIGHERAVLPNSVEFTNQESNYAQHKHDLATGTTPKTPKPSLYCLPGLPDYSNNTDIHNNQNNPLPEEQKPTQNLIDPNYPFYVDADGCLHDIVLTKEEQKPSNEPEPPPGDNRFYIKRRAIEGRQWAAGGAAAHEKGIKIELTDRMEKAIQKVIQKQPDVIRSMTNVNQVTGEKFSFGSLFLLNIMSFLNSPIPEFSNPIKELIQRLQSPYIPPEKVKNKDDTPCKELLNLNTLCHSFV